MRKVFALGMLVLIFLASCGPAEIIGPTPISTTIQAELAYPLELVPLSDTFLQFEMEQLVAETETRTVDNVQELNEWHSSPVVRWNEEARYWVIYYGLEPVVASRIYALVSVSQQRALDALDQLEINEDERKPELYSEDILHIQPGCKPFECAVVIGATEPILLHLFPDHQTEILDTIATARKALLASGAIFPSDLDAVEEFGRIVASDLIAERQNDGSADAKKFDSLPEGDGVWRLDAFRVKPEMPGWSKVTPWFLSSADQFRAPSPPEFGSPEYEAALDEVRQTMLTNTHRELEIADFWSDKRGSYTPPGHWNVIAAELVKAYDLSDREASHVFAALNMSMMDAGIACWDSKYFYYVIRPWQADPNIPTLIGYPNHPSYPSGHSCFSGAAAEILSYFFPAEREHLWAKAEEASISRLYGGVHYRFDLTAGKEMGRQVALLAQTVLKPLRWDVLE